MAVCWLKRRWKCAAPGCPRQTFTERLPQIEPRRRLTGRLRELLGAEVAGRGVTPAEAGRWHQVSWPVAHEAFIEQAEPQLAAPSVPVAHLVSMSTAAAGHAGGPMSRPGSTWCPDKGAVNKGQHQLRPMAHAC